MSSGLPPPGLVLDADGGAAQLVPHVLHVSAKAFGAVNMNNNVQINKQINLFISQPPNNLYKTKLFHHPRKFNSHCFVKLTYLGGIIEHDEKKSFSHAYGNSSK